MARAVVAQGQAGQDIATLKAGVGARPLGMGGAFTAIADNADAPLTTAQLSDQHILCMVGVLKLIHQNIPEPLPNSL